MKKLIITAAIQGAELTKEITPYLPVTPEEVAIEAKRAWEEGAAVIHLHVREPDGSPSQSTERYRENIDAIISTGCDAIIQVSTGGAVHMTAQERGGPLKLKPEYATLNTGSINFGQDVFINSVAIMEELALEMKKGGVRPEFEVYEEGHIHNAMALVRKGLVTGQLNFDFVLGVPGAMAPTVKNLFHLIDAIPHEANWTVSGIGRDELILGGVAVFIGGNVRVGMEDNIYYSKGVLAKSNSELVARIVRIAKEFDRDVANPAEARSILGIERKRA
ncbi:MAG: 3-keto-5-aminohexanoate cleavage protein [Syntrophales bacterium]|jgi:3-keto-5-aminohexanoate cleavage enzyme|nr:3-keto-5-aminohexanoate cleavage protein [Syntrophales bacterium]MCK9528692.1 3-keto-5-aminohexanoate cleavage protein [Syntrophales bacterium]MDX9922645.1 3-keto-5-aminohexanoate cleavage protein [Syntrophales bacterium]